MKNYTKKNHGFLAVGLVGIIIFLVLFYGIQINSGNKINKIFNIKSTSRVSALSNSSNLDNIELETVYDELNLVNNFSDFNNLKNNNSEINNFDLNKNLEVTNGYESLGSYEERLVYNKIKSGCDKITNDNNTSKGHYKIADIRIDKHNISTDTVKKCLYALQNDHPEIFWIASGFICGYTSKYTSIKLMSIFSKPQKQKAEKELEDKIKEIVSKIPNNSSDYEKELYIHDYIIKNCKYAKSILKLWQEHEKTNSYYSNNKNNIPYNEQCRIFTPYACLISNAAVCEGISKAFQMLCSRVGIDSRVIVGFRGKEPHMWNLVKIDGEWYQIDVTWDENSDFKEYTYFNLNDNQIKQDHTITKQLVGNITWPSDKRYNFKLPECNSQKYNYYTRNSVKISDLSQSSLQKISNKILNIVNSNQEKYLYVSVDDNSNLNTIRAQFVSNNNPKILKCTDYVNSKLRNNSQKINNNKIRYHVNNNRRVIIVKIK